MRINLHQRYEVGIEDNLVFFLFLGNWVEDKKELNGNKEEDKYLVLQLKHKYSFGRKMRTKIMNLK